MEPDEGLPMLDHMRCAIVRNDDALAETATWVTFTFAGMKYGPSYLERLQKRCAAGRLEKATRQPR